MFSSRNGSQASSCKLQAYPRELHSNARAKDALNLHTSSLEFTFLSLFSHVLSFLSFWVSFGARGVIPTFTDPN
eukprot:3122882-Amphidinium_carterae.1